MPLTQTQIIRSLAEALEWFEKELSWGVSPGELNHLTGRIGELYAAVMTRGQMALATNQRGYDVVSADNERISVKTITTSTNVLFNANTFQLVDRIMVLRLNIDDETGISVETLLDCSATDAKDMLGERLVFYPNRSSRMEKPIENLAIVDQAMFEGFLIEQVENGKILLSADGVQLQPVKPYLREIAAKVGFDILNGKGEAKNTQSLGAGLIKVLKALPQ